MKLTIDGREITARAGQSLLDMVKELGMITGKLSADPLAAKIAGEVFTLNYIPVREKDIQPERESIRKAMAASNGVVQLLRYCDPTGKDAYTRTVQFVLFLALQQLWPDAASQMNCTVGAGLYIKVTGAEDFSAEKLKRQVERIVEQDIPLLRCRISTAEAVEYYTRQGQDDKARLLVYRQVPTLDVYRHGDFADYFYGEMAPSTGFLRVWDIIDAPEGFMFIFPDDLEPDRVAAYREMPNFFAVYTEGKQWGELMECETVADLNELVDSGRIRELIRVNEALHEKRFSQVADTVCQRSAKAVMLAGPSSSGKTTSANRLATQLRVHGKKPVLMSLDDYYIDRDLIDPGPDGKIDFEHIDTIDTALFGQHLAELLAGQEVELPSFNFHNGKREWRGHKLRLHDDSVIIVEGLHALNPVLLPEGLDRELVFRLYVSPLLALNLDDHNRIPSSYLRLLRRTVRDYETRNSSVQRTLSMWDSVRRGEKRWIFPFQENADMIFNSSTLYELAVLKKHIFPLLVAVQPEDEYYDEVRAMVKILNFVHEADVDDEIPPTSLVREFIGGNSFYR
ncbi:MAG: nucleoside kinase [Oscillospiraceae bacterium]|nr:nucleoside kinase [Oscillospiraceae bacterium]